MSATNNLPTLSLEAAKIAAAAAEEKAKELGIGTSMAINLLSSTTRIWNLHVSRLANPSIIPI